MLLTIGTRDKILHAEGTAEELTRLVTRSLERMTPEEKEEFAPDVENTTALESERAFPSIMLYGS
jgi:hypothetical protein